MLMNVDLKGFGQENIRLHSQQFAPEDEAFGSLAKEVQGKVRNCLKRF